MELPALSAYIGIKFHADNRNRDLIERLSVALCRVGIRSHVVVRDVEEWGEVPLRPDQLMDRTFELIAQSDVVLIDISEKGVGLGIEAGYAHALSIPIVVAHRSGVEVSSTLQGIAAAVSSYLPDSSLDDVAATVFELGAASRMAP